MDTSPEKSQFFLSLRTLRVAATVGAAGLFAFGVFCWIAANWSAFHRLTRLGLVGFLLLASTAAATLAPRARTPALLVATAAVGGLLALIGQIYPSGADAWQLFAYWVLLALPFALAARHDSVWVCWTLVAGVAIGLWQQQERGGLASPEFGQAWTLAIALALIFAPFAPLRAFTGRADWAFRLASLIAITLIAFTGLIGVFESAERGSGALLISLLALAAAAGALARLRPLEFGVLTLAVAGLDALLIGMVYRAFESTEPEIMAALLIGVIAAAIVGGSVVLLRMVHARCAPPKATADKQGFSWPLAALSGFGALLAAFPFLILYGLLFGEEPTGAATGGILALGGAILLLRGGVPFGFRQMFGFIAVVVGFLLIGYAVVDAFGLEDSGFVLALMAGLVATFTPVRWVRALFGFAALLALTLAIVARGEGSDFTPATVALIVAAGAAMLVFVARRRDALAQSQPFCAGWNAAGLVVLALLAGRPFLAGGGTVGELGAELLATWDGGALAVSIVLGLAGVALLLWRRAELRTPLGFAAAACAVALTFRAPTLGAAIVVFAAAVVVESRSLTLAATLAIMWIVSAFYYALSWTLTEKAYVLMLLGAALGLAVFLTRTRRDGAEANRPRFASMTMTFIAVGLCATFAATGISVYGAEQILRDGRVVYLELRPVDPRSLLQGDYMALAFNTDHLPSPDDIRGAMLALADVDARSVATIQTLVPAGAQAEPNQIMLKLRPKSGRWFVGSDAFYFQEGTGADYEEAKFGRFRVGPDGRMLLTGLADANLKLLP